ncbi:hypothetical protein PMM47T1_13830 [Pseudomonas sp. M47T1]|uniref:hypothetical protein n=1 Tax=Pseudomonas sp. M47T1 TaxID=1179778 RepID=UPI00026085E1|nr:hypothetical protein [Pseudomonas sp. M47T1]EIK96044.1 hypothetical protein PMM47T1_13830 [Pseudomonas sp. M47T1]
MQHVKIRFARKTGFRRLWIVASIIWVIASSLFLWGLNQSASMIATIVAVPPVAVYALAAALVWVIEGFARAER